MNDIFTPTPINLKRNFSVKKPHTEIDIISDNSSILASPELRPLVKLPKLKNNPETPTGGQTPRTPFFIAKPSPVPVDQVSEILSSQTQQKVLKKREIKQAAKIQIRKQPSRTKISVPKIEVVIENLDDESISIVISEDQQQESDMTPQKPARKPLSAFRGRGIKAL